MKTVVFVLAILFALASARIYRPGPGHTIPRGWRDIGPAADHFRLHFTIALKQRNIPQLQEILSRVSDPDHADYGKWMTLDEINKMTEPSQYDISRIQQWLSRHRVYGKVTGDSVRCVAEVKDVSEMFAARFRVFEKISSHQKPSMLIRTLGTYTVPESMEDLVEFVSGLMNFPMSRRTPLKSRTIDPAQDNINGKVVPEVIRDLYHIPFVYRVNDNSSICLAEFQSDQSFNATDLKVFQTQTDDVINPVASNHIVGPYTPFPANLESSLDVQYGSAMALNASIWFWTSTGWMYDWANQFLQTPVTPYIVSMSWGWPENEQCQVGTCNGITSQQYVNRTEAEFLKITLRGVTLLAASGDQGAPGDGNPSCVNSVTPITTIYPGASQYVLAVGATALLQPTQSPSSPSTPSTSFTSPICQQYDCSTSTTEIVCSFPDALITSGGGFSMYIPQPSWQSAVVNTYIQYNQTGKVSIPQVRYVNTDNRAFPDVAALGHNYLVQITANLFHTGQWEIVDGTSCSTPVWSGMISLWNDIRQNQKKPTLGFVNPAVYKAYASNQACYNDITTGNNRCTESCCSQYGFDAYIGWDPVTGLGTPNYPALANYFTNLP